MRPSIVARCVCEWLEDGSPGGLVPYEFLPHIIPEFGKKLINAIRVIQKSIKTEVIDFSCWQPKPVTRLETVFESMLELSKQVEHFVFYVAGGMIVSEVLGFPPWSDVDVWFAPYRLSTNTRKWVVPGAKACAVVDFILVSEPLRMIQCFDLHICQCAIRCEMAHGQCTYRFLMTTACMQAFSSATAHLFPLHAGLAQPFRLRRRLQKYYIRSLGVNTDEFKGMHMLCQQEMTVEPWLSLLESAENMHFDLTSTQAVWRIRVIRDEVRCLDFAVRWYTPSAVLFATKGAASAPFIFHPCHLQKYDAARPSLHEAHWLVRVPKDDRIPITLPTGARISSSVLMPEWILERRCLTETALVNRVREEWTFMCASEEGCEEYQIRCEVPCKLLAVCKNWKTVWELEGGSCSYNTSWLGYFDTHHRSQIPSCAWCVKTGLIVTDCQHGSQVQALRVLTPAAGLHDLW